MQVDKMERRMILPPSTKSLLRTRTKRGRALDKLDEHDRTCLTQRSLGVVR